MKWLKEDDLFVGILVIVVIVFVMKGDEEKIIEGGCEVYIVKLIFVVLFLEIIKSFFEK